MKIDTRIKVHQVAGENIVMRVGADGTDMTTVIALNESSLLLFNRLHGRDFDIDDAAKVLCDEYEVDEATARRDVENLVQQMRLNGMLTDD